ncbi:MAG: carboxypeptidase-like regulatory domain-containing protein [Planctomycetota bacterium]
MTGSRCPTTNTRQRWVLGLGFVAAFLVLGGAWMLIMGGGEPRSPTRRVADPGNAPQADSVPAGDLRSREDSLARQPVSVPLPNELDQPSGAEWKGTGVIRLRITDDVTGAPIPRLEFNVFSERPYDHALGQGVSDESGCALLTELPADVVLIETERQPPYAPMLAAVWLTAGGREEAELRVKRGGTLTGRVVDNLRQPVAEAQIRLVGRFDDEPVAATDRDGRFAVECVVSHPKGVWVVDGKPRPEQWRPVSLEVSKDGRHSRASEHVDDGQTKDVGDIVLPRHRYLAGRVLDESGGPISRALVSANFSRGLFRKTFGATGDPSEIDYSLGPTSEGLTLGPDESLSDEAGRFTLSCGEQPTRILVWTPEDVRETLAAPRVAPGERKDDIVFVVPARTVLYVQVLDPDGSAAIDRTRALSESGLQLTAFNRLQSMYQLVLTAVLEDGRRTEHRERYESDGFLRFQFDFPLERIAAIELALGGYLPLRDDVRGRLTNGCRLRYELTPFPRLHLRLRAGAELLSSSDGPKYLILLACLAPPESRRTWDTWRECCGLGSLMSIALEAPSSESRELVKEIAVPVQAQRPYWVTVEVRPDQKRSRFSDEPDNKAHFGPFAPGTAVQEIELPAELFRAAAQVASAAAKNERQPPALSSPGDDDNMGALVAEIRNAVTQQPIAEAEFHLTRTVDPTSSPRQSSREHLYADGAGRIMRKVPADHWQVSVKAYGYADSEPFEIDVASGEPTVLGVLELEPFPTFEGRLVQADGVPPPSGTAIIAAARATSSTGYDAKTKADGSFSIPAPLPDSFVAVVIASDIESDGVRLPRGAQVVHVQRAASHEPQELRLRPWQSVEICVEGMDPALEQSLPGVLMRYDPRDPVFGCGHADGQHPFQCLLYGTLRGEELDSDTEGMRRFRFVVGPGRYEIEVGSLLCRIPLTLIEVGESPGLQVFRVAAR